MQIREGDQLYATAALPPKKQPRYLLRRRMFWPREPVWKIWRREISLAPTGNRTTFPWLSIPQSSRYADWIILAATRQQEWLIFWMFCGVTTFCAQCHAVWGKLVEVVLQQFS